MYNNKLSFDELFESYTQAEKDDFHVVLCDKFDLNKIHTYLYHDEQNDNLYVMIDDEFSFPIADFKQLLYTSKILVHMTPKHFDFVHTLYDDYVLKQELKEELKEELKDKLDIIQMKNHNAYSDFYNLNRTPVSNCSRIDTANLKFLNLKNYNPLNKQIFPQAKSLADKYNVTKVYFGNNFNYSIDKLPDSIEWLVLGKKFNQPIKKCIRNLKYLTFGHDFNKPVSKSNLPNGFERIVFGIDFNQPIDDLPDSITHISFYVDYIYYDTCKFGMGECEKMMPTFAPIYKSKFAQLVKRLPNNLTHLHCEKIKFEPNAFENTKLTHAKIKTDSYEMINYLPKSLKNLIMYGNYENYNCDHIHICKLENLECLVMDINTSASKLLQNLPQNLECLILNLSCTDNINLTNLPTKLKYLKLSSDTFFYDNNNSNVVNLEYLPCSLTHLTINIKSAKLLLNNLPLSITHACVNLNFFKELEQYSNIKNRICI